jgi:hypothetical protein
LPVAIFGVLTGFSFERSQKNVLTATFWDFTFILFVLVIDKAETYFVKKERRTPKMRNPLLPERFMPLLMFLSRLLFLLLYRCSYMLCDRSGGTRFPRAGQYG